MNEARLTDSVIYEQDEIILKLPEFGSFGTI